MPKPHHIQIAEWRERQTRRNLSPEMRAVASPDAVHEAIMDPVADSTIAHANVLEAAGFPSEDLIYQRNAGRQRLNTEGDDSGTRGREEITEPSRAQPSRFETSFDNPQPIAHASYTADTDAMEDVVMTRAPAAATADGQTTNNGKTTTAVMKIPPSFPFHEGINAIMEYDAQFSWNDASKDAYNHCLMIKMNTPFDIFAGTTALVAQKPYENPVGGLSTTMAGRSCQVIKGTDQTMSSYLHRDLMSFKCPLNITANAKPTMLTYYENIYQAYTVVKCDWSLDIQYPTSHIYLDAITGGSPTFTSASIYNGCEWGLRLPGTSTLVAFTKYDVTGDSTPLVANNIPVDIPMKTMMKTRGYVNKEWIPHQGHKRISGTWYPGKCKHTVINDADMDTWTRSGEQPANGHLEQLVFQLKQDLMSTTLVNYKACANIALHVAYTVQWRDLVPGVRHANAYNGAISIDANGVQQQANPNWEL